MKKRPISTASVTQVRIGLIVHEDDTVATLLDDRTDLTQLADGHAVDAGIPFGHKVAVRAMKKGDAVIKYGVVIGLTTDDVPKGAHVHVHNVR